MNDINEIKNEIRKKLKRDISNLIENYEDNLAMVIASEYKEYSVDYCADSPNDGNTAKYATDISDCIDKIVENELNILFVNV